MPLLIIESPNKIKKLRAILGGSYKVMATKGHVLDLPPKKVGVSTRDMSFDPTYEVIRGQGDTIKKIVAEAKNHKTIYLGTDPDREGEAIAFHIASKLPKRGKTIKRVRFNAITKAAVQAAIASPEDLNQALFDAQQARRVTDRLVGYRISPIMWRKGIHGASAGRVQSVALKYVVDREREIEAFEPQEYWEIDAVMNAGFKARMWGLKGNKRTVRQGDHARGIKKALMEGTQALKVLSVERKTRRRKAAPPFTTASLQQAANKVLGWSVDKTMKVAQDIFSAGVITYHRTDSVDVDKEVLSDLRKSVSAQHGKDYSAQNNFKSKKASQEAHECIRPTGEDPGELDPDSKRLFDLIRDRYVASQMAAAVFEQMKVDLVSVDTDIEVNFRVNGSKLVFDGHLKVYGSATSDVILPDLSEGDELPYSDVELAQKFTQPPPRYSDASLVKRMEKDGVGRPATYASIVKVLQTREFTVKDDKAFRATDLGKMVSDYMSRFFPELVDPEFTAQMEASLDSIADRGSTYTAVLGEWYDPFKVNLKKAGDGDIKDLFRTEYPCSVCDKGFLLKRPSKDGGYWYSCDQYPDCKTVALQNDDGTLVIEDGVIQVRETKPKPSMDIEEVPSCPTCNSDMSLIDGKYGKFWGCTQYKAGCKSTRRYQDPDEEDDRVIFPRVNCPKCQSDMYKADGKYGTYLRCVEDGCRGSHPIPMGICPTCDEYVVQRYSRKKKKKFYCCTKWSDDCDWIDNSLSGAKCLPQDL